jgi:hypothetical protein
VTRAVFAHITTGGYSISSLAKQAGQLLQSERIIVWSADAAAEVGWKSLNAAGSLGSPALNAAHFTLTSIDASKLGAFLHTSLEMDNCATSAPTLTVQLSNQAPATPPAYMETHVLRLALTTMRLVYSFYVAPQWSISSVTVNGNAQPFSSELEGGWRLVRGTIEIPRGSAVTVKINLRGQGLTKSNTSGVTAVKVSPEAYPVATSTARCGGSSATAPS